MMWRYWDVGFGPLGWIGMGLVMLTCFALVILGIWALIRVFTRDNRVHAGAGEILRDRFAKGEIDETEYRKRMDVLRGK